MYAHSPIAVSNQLTQFCFFDPNISAFCFPLFCFCDYIPLVSTRLPVDPFFYRSSFILLPLHLSTILNSFEFFGISSSVARCAAHLSTPLHTFVLSFSLLLFFLTCFATSSVVLPYYLFYSVLAMKWDYFHSLAVLRSQQFLYVEIPHTLTHTIEHSIDILFRLQCATPTEPRCCWLWILQLPTPRIRFRS